jgi:tetratricopeptide (TPR) repeat protein
MRQSTRLRQKFSAIVCAAIVAAAVSASAKEGETRTCKAYFGGQVICGDLIIGITREQYEAGLKKRAEEIRAEEAEKRVQLQKLMELTERATSAEKDSLRAQIATVEAEKRVLEAESKGVAERLTNLQASYDGLVQKLADANAALEAFAPLISAEAFMQAQAMLSRGDVLGAERKFVEIADTVRKIKEQADVVEARAIFEAGKLAEVRIDWRTAYAHYARAARLQPSNWLYVAQAGNLARMMGDYSIAASFDEATLSLVTSTFGPDARETLIALNDLATAYQSLARYLEAEPLYRQAIEVGERVLGKDHPDVAVWCNNLATLLRDQGKYHQAEPLVRRAIEINERALGKDHPDVAINYSVLALLLQDQGKYDQAEPLYRQAIEVGERVLGKDHPDVAPWYNNLATLLQAQGKYDQAEPLVRRAIEITEKVVGKDHPNVAITYNVLARLLQDQGKYDEAEPLYRRAMEICQTKLGLDHPNTVTARKNYDHLQELKKQKYGNAAR